MNCLVIHTHLQSKKLILIMSRIKYYVLTTPNQVYNLNLVFPCSSRLHAVIVLFRIGQIVGVMLWMH